MNAADKISSPQIPMGVTTAQEQTPKSYYETFKQYIPCCESAEPRALRTYFSLAKQYLPTSIYLVAGIGTCVNAYNGDGLSALYYAGGGLAAMLLHDTCLGGPPAPVITPQQIVDLERQQEANANMLQVDAQEAADISKLEEKETQDLQADVNAVTDNHAALSHVIDIGNENEKEGEQLIDGLESTLSSNVAFLKKLNQGV